MKLHTAFSPRPAHHGPAIAVVWGSDGSLISAGDDGDVLQFPAGDPSVAPTKLFTLPSPPIAGDAYPVYPAGGSPAHMAFACADGSLCVSAPDLRSWVAHTAVAATAVSWSPCRSLIASAAADGSIAIWTAGGTLYTRLPSVPGPVAGVAWAPDASSVAVIAGSYLTIIPIPRPAPAPTPPAPVSVRAHAGAATAIAWTSGALVTGGDDSFLRSWEVSSLFRLFQSSSFAQKLPGPVCSLSVTHDGSAIAAVSAGQLLVVHGFTRRVIACATLPGPFGTGTGGTGAVVWNGEGSAVAVAGAGGGVVVADILEGEHVEAANYTLTVTSTAVNVPRTVAAAAAAAASEAVDFAHGRARPFAQSFVAAVEISSPAARADAPYTAGKGGKYAGGTSASGAYDEHGIPDSTPGRITIAVPHVSSSRQATPHGPDVPPPHLPSVTATSSSQTPEGFSAVCLAGVPSPWGPCLAHGHILLPSRTGVSIHPLSAPSVAARALPTRAPARVLAASADVVVVADEVDDVTVWGYDGTRLPGPQLPDVPTTAAALGLGAGVWKGAWTRRLSPARVSLSPIPRAAASTQGVLACADASAPPRVLLFSVLTGAPLRPVHVPGGVAALSLSQSSDGLGGPKLAVVDDLGGLWVSYLASSGWVGKLSATVREAWWDSNDDILCTLDTDDDDGIVTTWTVPTAALPVHSTAPEQCPYFSGVPFSDPALSAVARARAHTKAGPGARLDFRNLPAFTGPLSAEASGNGVCVWSPSTGGRLWVQPRPVWAGMVVRRAQQGAWTRCIALAKLATRSDAESARSMWAAIAAAALAQGAYDVAELSYAAIANLPCAQSSLLPRVLALQRVRALPSAPARAAAAAAAIAASASTAQSTEAAAIAAAAVLARHGLRWGAAKVAADAGLWTRATAIAVESDTAVKGVAAWHARAHPQAPLPPALAAALTTTGSEAQVTAADADEAVAEEAAGVPREPFVGGHVLSGGDFSL